MRTYSKYLLGIVLMVASTSSFAQIGSIAGYVRAEIYEDAIEGIPFAEIRLVKDGEVIQTRASDYEGLYRFENVEPGEYQLVISSIGFNNDTVSEVRVQYGRRTVVDVQLEEVEDTVEPLDCLYRAKRFLLANRWKERDSSSDEEYCPPSRSHGLKSRAI